jgi:rod shape determining protein RodA
MYEPGLNVRQSRVEWGLLLGILGLMVVGGAFIFSATAATDQLNNTIWYRNRFVTQVAYYTFGLLVAASLSLVNYRVVCRWSLVIYWLSIFSLILVFFIGKKLYGARRWIDLGFMSIQPSEFAKLAVIVAQANFLSRPLEELRLPGVFWKSLGLTALPFVLILKEPDLGSALVLLPAGLAMMFVAGVPVKRLAKVVGGTALLVILLLVDILFAPPGWWKVKLEDYQRHRLLVYFDRDFTPPNATPEQRRIYQALKEEKTYNVKQALISVGSGGVAGKGWRQGAQSALGYLPARVAHNDFIFSVIAEEKGFVGSAIVLALYTVVLFTGIKIAGQARDRLGRLLAVGVVTLLFSHVFINIGMNIRIMPVTGIPLPLLSHGGSSVVCALIAAGILQNVYLYRRSY